MHTLGTFALYIQPGDPLRPARVTIIVQGLTEDDENGRLFITPACVSLEELEGQINALQDSLDLLRARAKRAFQRED